LQKLVSLTAGQRFCPVPVRSETRDGTVTVNSIAQNMIPSFCNKRQPHYKTVTLRAAQYDSMNFLCNVNMEGSKGTKDIITEYLSCPIDSRLAA